MTDTLTITVNINLSTGEPTVDVHTVAVRPTVHHTRRVPQPASVDTVKDKVVAAASDIIGSEMWCGRRRADMSAPATYTDFAVCLSKAQKVVLNTALDELLAEGVLVAVTDGKTTRYPVNVDDTEGN